MKRGKRKFRALPACHRVNVAVACRTDSNGILIKRGKSMTTQERIKFRLARIEEIGAECDKSMSIAKRLSCIEKSEAHFELLLDDIEKSEQERVA